MKSGNMTTIVSEKAIRLTSLEGGNHFLIAQTMENLVKIQPQKNILCQPKSKK